MIKMQEMTGEFAENKDIARDIRVEKIVPKIEKGETVILDFQKVEAATQSFIHALISELIRKHGSEVFERIEFKNCNEKIRKIITMVADYMQESE